MKRFVVALLMMLGASAAYGETMYTWKDARGTVFYSNSLNDIPARYLKKARVYDVATGKKGGLATAQPVVQGGPAGSPGQAAVQPAPAPTPLAMPAPPVAAPPVSGNGVPAVTSPAPPPVPAAAGVPVPQAQPRQTGEQRRMRRTRDRSRSSEDE
jgi:hypothetical protein